MKGTLSPVQILSVAAGVAVVGLLYACGQSAEEGSTALAPIVVEQPVSAAAAPAPSTQKVQDMYGVTPTPLTVAQCGQCHLTIFNKIKENGQRHRFDCQECHQQLHAYNPKKQNWDEIIPQCSSCHTLPHGEAFTGCLDCHSDPHTPLVIGTAAIADACGTCHTNPQGQLTQYPSMHTEQGCDTCHTSHGLIPSCMECHDTHVPEQPLAACTSCHPVHKPLQVSYDDSPANNTTCGSCHDGVFGEWSQTKSLHGGVSCASCHDQHGLIPDCGKCHDQPHDAKLLQKFPRCLDCHINVHDLPTKRVDA